MGVTDVIRVLAPVGRFRNSPNACYVRHTTPPFRLTRYELLLRPSPPVASVNILRQSDQLPAECGHVTSFCAAPRQRPVSPCKRRTLRASARPHASRRWPVLATRSTYMFYTRLLCPPGRHTTCPRRRVLAAPQHLPLATRQPRLLAAPQHRLLATLQLRPLSAPRRRTPARPQLRLLVPLLLAIPRGGNGCPPLALPFARRH